MERSSRSQYAVAIVGGAAAGAEAAGLLAERGVLAVVFEQNARPYGKIEDGLPRWHVRLRQKEYETINERLSRPGVYFVPKTKIGRDIDFRSLVNDWGFTAVLLAHGAWHDRSLPIEGADEYVGRGLIYQNAFIYWFNHFPEKDYEGPRYDVVDGTIVVGGGLASIDVMKALQIELVRRRLQGRGIEEDVLHIEHDGIPAVLEAHGLEWKDLGLQGTTLFYRRRIEDMPLADPPEGADEARRKKFEATRCKILEKATQKFCFHVRPQMVPVDLIVEAGRLVGLRFQHTRVENGKAVPIENAFEDVRAPLVISSIGSIPEPMPGIEQSGALYRYVDRELGRLAGYETVFSTGNVVTGKGNILDSRRHSINVTMHLVENFLGLDEGDHEDEEAVLDMIAHDSEQTVENISTFMKGWSPLEPEALKRLLDRVRARQRVMGYDGSYMDWIERVTPPDLA